MAAVERRRNKTSEVNDNFYISTVTPAIRDIEHENIDLEYAKFYCKCITKNI